MFNLSYFNLGFRSDSVSNLLTKLQTEDVLNNFLLDDAFLIVDDCLKIQDEDTLISNFSHGKGYEINILLPLLSEVFSNMTIENIVNELRRLHETIKKVKTDRKSVNPEEFEAAIGFFSKLADICLSNSSHLSVKESISFL